MEKCAVSGRGWSVLRHSAPTEAMDGSEQTRCRCGRTDEPTATVHGRSDRREAERNARRRRDAEHRSSPTGGRRCSGAGGVGQVSAISRRSRSWVGCRFLSVACFLLLVMFGSVAGQDTLKYKVTEEDDVGVFVGDVFQDMDLVSKYNGDQSIINQLRFRFLRGAQQGFVIDEKTGVIRTSARIDRESDRLPCHNKDNCDIKLDVAIQPIQYFQIVKVAVEVLDINDNYPQFSERSITHSVPESTFPDSTILTVNVRDVDSPKNSIQRFELLPAANTVFRLTSSSQMDGSIEIKLKLQQALDRETISEYNLRIVAYDGGDPSKTGSVDVQILVLDANDNSPTFSSPNYEVSIPEDVEVPQVIIRVHATDPDVGLNGEIVYGLTASTLKHYGDKFVINESTGDIQLVSRVDYEQMPVYTLGVTAVDKGPSASSADASVVVTLLDVNDHAPEISISTLATDGSKNAVVPENAPIGTFVSHFSVTDPDSGDNARVSCHLDSSHFRLEFLYDSEYQMLTLTEFDREALGQYSVTIICEDHGVPSMTAKTTVLVDVSDVNDHAPQFEQDIYNAELIENNFEGAVATVVKAVDYDTGINAEIIYSIADSVRHLFSVDPDSGEIQARVAVDREQLDRFEFKVYATDKGVPPRSAEATVIIHVQDVNDESPIFNQPNYSFGVFENEKSGTEVGMLLAEDADGFPFNQFTYRFSQETDAFYLDPDSGRITTRRILDREEQSVYHLIAEAVDVDASSQRSGTVSVSIYVADQNDNYPAFVFPSKVNNTAYVAKDVPYGYIVTRLNAVDLDIGNNARIVYDIVSGNEEHVFDIDYERGTILVNKDLHSYEDSSFLLNVTAEDSGIPQLATWSYLTITVNGSMALQPMPTSSSLSLGGNNLVIVIALASTSGVITIILIMAIICIRRQDSRRDQSNGRYNCRMEALKFINGNKRKKLVDGSTSSGSTSNGSDNGDVANKSKKEVSFSLEQEETGADLTQDKSGKSWCSVIDQQTLQTPRACSSLLTSNSSLPAAPYFANGNMNKIPHHYDGQRGTYSHGTGTNGQPRSAPSGHREIEIQHLLELLKRDQDSSSLTSGEGSNTDSGRGASEEGDMAGPKPPSQTADINGSAVSHVRLTPVLEDSYSSNQVVPSSFCESSYMSLHNTTVGSYLQSEEVRAASRASQRPISSASNHALESAKENSVVLDMSGIKLSPSSSHLDHSFYDARRRSPKQLKSILKPASKPSALDQITPLAQQGLDNYLKSRMVETCRACDASSEMSEMGSEAGNTDLKYSCADMSDILRNGASAEGAADFLAGRDQRSANVDVDDDDDGRSSTTSGSYVVDPKELCDEIDQLFFKDLA